MTEDQDATTGLHRHAAGNPNSTEPVSTDVRAFFAAFEDASNSADPATTAEQFADVFLALDPVRVAAVPKPAFLAALPQRAEMFAAIGRRRIRLTALTETRLDDLHVLVDTAWEADLVDPDGMPDTLPLSSVFVLRREPGGLRIVVYLNRQDIVGAINARRDGSVQHRLNTPDTA